MRSIEREGDNVVATAKIDLGIAPRPDHDILLAANHVGRGWGINACSGAEVPQFLAVGRIVGRELAVAFTRENKTACGSENAADPWISSPHPPVDFDVVGIDGGYVAL